MSPKNIDAASLPRHLLSGTSTAAAALSGIWFNLSVAKLSLTLAGSFKDCSLQDGNAQL